MSNIVTGMDDISLMINIINPIPTITTKDSLNTYDTILNNAVIIR